MTVRYWHEFYGLDGVKNRFEILTDGGVAEEIICSPDAFSLEYPRVDKLDVFRSSQATLNLLSERNFQFVDLHTEDMQSHLVKFYRDGALIWIGYLDSETYNERITDMTPYPVEFYASDFFILERLKYRKADGTPYTDIVSLFTHIQRCFQKLNLPFGKLNIGCTTTPDGIDLLAAETVLHRTYVQSSNFYDEDNDAMTCKEVIEAILKPFGLSIIQVLGDVYICDMNTLYAPVKHDVLETQLGLLADNFGRIISFKTTGLGIPLKQYNMSDFSYIGDVSNNFKLTDLGYGRFMGQDGEYGFDTMINNVTINSSIYADANLFKEDITEDTLDGKTTIVDTSSYRLDEYTSDKNYINLTSNYYAYLNKNNASTNIGYRHIYDVNPVNVTPALRVESNQRILSNNGDPYVKVKVGAYINTRTNPFDSDDKSDLSPAKRQTLRLYCNLYAVDENGNMTAFFANGDGIAGGWLAPEHYQEGSLWLIYSDKDAKSSDLLNKNITNNNVLNGYAGFGELLDKNYQSGLFIALNYVDYWPEFWVPVSGKLVFEITSQSRVGSYDPLKPNDYAPNDKIKEILISNVELSLCDNEGNELNTDDYEFKSYIDKRVKSDLPSIELKCISANEENLPVGKGNILSIEDGTFKIHTSFTRSDQTDILERLLMVTIHSNYTKKNQKFNAVIDLNEVNPLGYITYSSQLRGRFLLTGCRYDFNMASVTVSAVEFQKDTDKLSNIPYE